MSDAAADQLLGRQPILDREQQLRAYELLFRSGSANFAQVTDGIQATATVIANAFTELGVEAALGSHRGFINVDEQFLFSDLLELLPRHAVVLEILRNRTADPAVIERCAALKAAGSRWPSTTSSSWNPNLPTCSALVEIVKVDIQPLSRVQLIQLVMELKPLGKQLLAEKVDSESRWSSAQKLRLQPVPGLLLRQTRPSSPARNWTIRNCR